MASPVYTQITIGGTTAPAIAEELRKLLVDQFGTFEQKERMASRGIRNYGNADEVEDFCFQHKLPFVLSWAEQSGVEAGMRAWRPGLGNVAKFSANSNGVPAVSLTYLKAAQKQNFTLASLIASLEIGDPSTLPAFVEVAATAA